MRIVIAEKDQAAQIIANVLNCKPVNGYWMGDKYIVIGARGHVFGAWLKGLKKVSSIKELPLTEIIWRPTIKDKFIILKKLFSERKYDSVIVATDYDREGEVIGYWIVRKFCGLKDPVEIQRAYFSALTYDELRIAFDDIRPMREDLLAQGLARNIADTIIGLNLTRALTIIFKNRYKKLSQAISLGRVQSPVLSFIKKISNVKYYSESKIIDFKETIKHVFLKLNDSYVSLSIDIPDNVDMVRITEIDEIETDEKQEVLLPDLFRVQMDMPFRAEITEEILENLYLKGWTTYPRTDQHYIARSMASTIENIMRDHGLIGKDFSWSNYSLVVDDAETRELGKKPAIILTPEGIKALVNGKILGRELIVSKYLLTRMIQAMAPPLKIKKTFIVMEINNEKKRILWSEECLNIKHAVIKRDFTRRPTITPGEYKILQFKEVIDRSSVVSSAFEPDITVPSDKEILGWMEKNKLGTPATRSRYTTELSKRNYIDTENLLTILGAKIVEIIETIGLTKELTKRMEEKISSLKYLFELKEFKEWVIEITKELLSKLLEENIKIEFKCPYDHEAELINTAQGLFLFCEQCRKFYPIKTKK